MQKENELFQDPELTKDMAFRLKGQIDPKFLEEYEKELLALNNIFVEQTGIDLIISSNIFACSKCQCRVWNKEITDKKCLACNSIINPRNIKRVKTYRLNENIKTIWGSGLWFEAYLARLLRKIGFKTWIGVHLMGASGILHEIDVVAIKKGTLVVCECKTGKVTRNDVFNFYTKVGDTKAHFSILAMIGELPEPQTRNFIRRNPGFISLENMGTKDSSKIFEYLKDRLAIK